MCFTFEYSDIVFSEISSSTESKVLCILSPSMLSGVFDYGWVCQHEN